MIGYARRVAGLLAVALLATACASARHAAPVPHPAKPKKESPAYDRDAMRLFLDAKKAEMKGDRARATVLLAKAVVHDSTSGTLYGALARNLHALERHDQALDPARKAVTMNPDDAQLRWILFQALMEKGLSGGADTTAALNQLEALSKMVPNPLGVYDNLLKIYASQGRRGDYLRTLDRIVALPFLDGRGHLTAAEAYASQGAGDQAIAQYEEGLSTFPDRIPTWHKLANLQLSRGDSLQAAITLAKGVGLADFRVDPATGPLWGMLTRLYESDSLLDSLLLAPEPDTVYITRLAETYLGVAVQGLSQDKAGDVAVRQFERAIRIFTQLNLWNPNDPQPLGKLGEIYLHLDRPLEARSALNRALKLGPRPIYLLGLAQTYRLEENWGAVIGILGNPPQRIRSDSFAFPRVVTELATAYRATGQLTAAGHLYRMALEVDPTRIVFRYEHARNQVFLENWQDAAAELSSLLPDTEANPALLKDVLFELGRSLERLGRFDESVDAFHRLLAMAPLDHRSLNYVGYMLGEKGIRLKEAEQYVERALQAQPDSGPYMDSLGWIYYQQARYPEAIEYLSRAIQVEENTLKELEPDHPGRPGQEENLKIILDHAGDAANAMGRKGHARSHWERALQLDPGNETIQQKLNHLAPSDTPPEDAESGRDSE
jgi:tetratricopeptide (TPR) repeat protein